MIVKKNKIVNNSDSQRRISLCRLFRNEKSGPAYVKNSINKEKINLITQCTASSKNKTPAKYVKFK